MDKSTIRDLLLAFKTELVRFRFPVVLFFILISFAVLAVGVFWPKQYTSGALLVADSSTIYEPLFKGRAPVTSIDRSEQAREIIYTRSILESAARQAGLLKESATAKEVDQVVRDIRSGLSTRAEKNNYFRITYSSIHPDATFETLNAVVNVFIEDIARKKRDESLGAFNFIDAQVQSYKRQLEQAEEKLKIFTGQNTDGTEASVTNRIAALRNEIESLKISIEESKTRIATVQTQLSQEGQYQQAKGQIDELRQRRQGLVTQLENLLLLYQENYPDVISLRAQISELDNSIATLQASGEVFGNNDRVENPLYEELRKQQQAADLDLRSQQRRMESLSNLLEQEYERARRVAANRAELSDLTRDMKVIQDVYEEMLQRKESARVSMTLDIEGQGTSYRIQEPAAFPLKPSGLYFLHFAILGPILGLLASLGLLIVYVLLDPHIRSARALQQSLPEGMDVIGSIPHYNTPLGERLLRKDIIGLLLLSIIAIAAYAGFAVYWQFLRG